MEQPLLQHLLLWPGKKSTFVARSLTIHCSLQKGHALWLTVHCPVLVTLLLPFHVSRMEMIRMFARGPLYTEISHSHG